MSSTRSEVDDYKSSGERESRLMHPVSQPFGGIDVSTPESTVVTFCKALCEWDAAKREFEVQAIAQAEEARTRRSGPIGL